MNTIRVSPATASSMIGSYVFHAFGDGERALCKCIGYRDNTGVVTFVIERLGYSDEQVIVDEDTLCDEERQCRSLTEHFTGIGVRFNQKQTDHFRDELIRLASTSGFPDGIDDARLRSAVEAAVKVSLCFFVLFPFS